MIYIKFARDDYPWGGELVLDVPKIFPIYDDVVLTVEGEDYHVNSSYILWWKVLDE